MKIKILLADDHELLRQGLRNMLEDLEGHEVAAEASTGRDAVLLAKKIRPDIVLMDISMPDMNGIAATKAIRAQNPEIRVIGLSMYSDCRMVKNMLKAGASGYLLKNCAFNELAEAIKAVMSGHGYLSPELAGVIIEDYRHGLVCEDELSLLTLRQKEVLQLIAEGKSSKEISSSLNLSLSTVENHRQTIMNRLNIRTIAGLTKFALREGLTDINTL